MTEELETTAAIARDRIRFPTVNWGGGKSGASVEDPKGGTPFRIVEPYRVSARSGRRVQARPDLVMTGGLRPGADVGW